jgi:hypothetical protein
MSGSVSTIPQGCCVATSAENGTVIGPPRAKAVLTVEVTSSHGILSDYDQNYCRGGKVYQGPIWSTSQNHPFTHTGGQFMEVNVTIRHDPAFDGAGIKVVGRVTSGNRMTGHLFVGQGQMRNDIVSAQLKSKHRLPRGIYRTDFCVDWSLDYGQGPIVVGSTGPHRAYVTLGTPVSDIDPSADEEELKRSTPTPGVTLKRLDRAVELVHKVRGESLTDPHVLAGKLMSLFPRFSLDDGKAFLSYGGAWRLADRDKISDSGECQAIVRLVKNILDIVGAPGERQVRRVWADPDDPTGGIDLVWVPKAERDTKLPCEDDRDDDPTLPPRRKRMKLVDVDGERRGWGIALITEAPPFPKKVNVKRGYGPRWKVGLVSDAVARPYFLKEGPNGYEACLRMTAAGVTKYYGGGTGGAVFRSKDEVIRKVFWGMVWTMLDPLPSGKNGFRMMEIRHIYK